MIKNKNLKKINTFDRPKFEIWDKMNKIDKKEFEYRFVNPLQKGMVFTLLILDFICIFTFFIMLNFDAMSGFIILLLGYFLGFIAGMASRKSRREQEKWFIKKKYMKKIDPKKSKKEKKSMSKILKGLLLLIGILILICLYLTGLMNGYMQMLLGNMLDEDGCNGKNDMYYVGERFCTQEDPNYVVVFNCRGVNSKLGLHIDIDKPMNGFDRFVGEAQLLFFTGCWSNIIPLGEGN